MPQALERMIVVARVRPFRAYRYAVDRTDITPLVAPPYDVISPEQRAELLSRDVNNIVALELPDGPLDPDVPGNRYETGSALWRTWRDSGVMRHDDTPTLYVLEQRFVLGGSPVRRRAFIAEVELHAFEEGVVLPHERTLPKALGDRLNLTRSTAANLSQVFGLYADPAQVTTAAFDEAMSGPPLLTATDDDGVESVLWAVTDTALIERVVSALADSSIFIADGHHRYTTALAYRDERRAEALAAGKAPTDPDYDFVMMALVNMDDPELVVLPTHRVADSHETFDPAAFWEAVSGHFVVEDLPEGHPSGVLDAVDGPAFLVKTAADDRARLVRLRTDIDLDAAIPLDRSAAWKGLDVAILQELILLPLLDIHPDKPETLDRLHFVKDAHEALGSVPGHDVAFVLRATRMDQLRAVALAGETMPQKSTYFYPKLLSGLVVRGMDDE